jgi:hypothetical protein
MKRHLALLLALVVPSGTVMGGDPVLTVVLAQYAALDADCTARPIQVTQARLPPIGSSLAELGIDLPRDCDAFAWTARVVDGAGGEISLASEVSPLAAATLGTIDCTQPPTSVQILDDLVLTSGIDLNAIPPGSCLGLREYAVQLTSRPDSTATYEVSVDAKYICTSSVESPDPCNTPQGQLPGPGWNQGVESPGSDGLLTPGECFPIEYRNDDGIFSLPNCCDAATIDAIVQCASFAVTAVDGQVCSPAFISGETFDAESRDGSPVQFGCSFFPTNHKTAESFLCEVDCDLDGTPDTCETPPEVHDTARDAVCGGFDNCPTDFNPGQEDSDSDGTGTPCDCHDLDPGVWATPGEVLELRLSHDPLSATTSLVWSPPSEPGGTTVAYDTLQSAVANDFVSAPVCVESNDASDTSSTDLAVGPGVAFYLVRAENTCGQGTVGISSAGVPRAAAACAAEINIDAFLKSARKKGLGAAGVIGGAGSFDQMP